MLLHALAIDKKGSVCLSYSEQDHQMMLRLPEVSTQLDQEHPYASSEESDYVEGVSALLDAGMTYFQADSHSPRYVDDAGANFILYISDADGFKARCTDHHLISLPLPLVIMQCANGVGIDNSTLAALRRELEGAWGHDFPLSLIHFNDIMGPVSKTGLGQKPRWAFASVEPRAFLAPWSARGITMKHSFTAGGEDPMQDFRMDLSSIPLSEDFTLTNGDGMWVVVKLPKGNCLIITNRDAPDVAQYDWRAETRAKRLVLQSVDCAVLEALCSLTGGSPRMTPETAQLILYSNRYLARRNLSYRGHPLPCLRSPSDILERDYVRQDLPGFHQAVTSALLKIRVFKHGARRVRERRYEASILYTLAQSEEGIFERIHRQFLALSIH